MWDSRARLQPNRSDVTAKVIDGEAIIMNLTTGVYYSMDGAGAVIWELLDQGHSLGEVACELAQRFQRTTGQTEPEVRRLVEELIEEGLMGPAPADLPLADPIPEVPAVARYQPPQLHKYTDMADLLALDPPMPALGAVPAEEG